MHAAEHGATGRIFEDGNRRFLPLRTRYLGTAGVFLAWRPAAFASEWFALVQRTLPKKGESLTTVCAAEAPPTYEKTGAGALVDMALDARGTRFRSPARLARPTHTHGRSLGRKSGS